MKSILGAVTAGVLSFGSALSFAAESKSADSQACSQQEEVNKKIIETTLAKGPPAFLELVDPGYVQHNPAYVLFGEINGVSGGEALKLYEQRRLSNDRPFAAPKLAPGQPRDNFKYQIVADCDIVIVVGQHWHPYPTDASKFYATYFFNMWRMKDGRLTEHWDPNDLPNPLPDYLTAPANSTKDGKG